MNKHAVSTSVLNHPLHHRFYFFRKYEYRPVGYWEWTSRAVVGIKHAGVIIVEEIMAIWPKSLVELGHKLITDVVSILNLFLTRLKVKQMDMIGVNLCWNRFYTRLISVHFVESRMSVAQS